MPSCVVCGKTLVCTAQSTHPPVTGVDSAVKPCPLKKGAIWVHCVDDKGVDVRDVVVSVDGVEKATDANGISAFDPMEAKTYVVAMKPLDGKLAKGYETPAELKESVAVNNGEITYVVFELKRLAKLRVKVVQKGEPTKFIGKVSVAVTGAETPPEEKTKTTDGVADFGPRKAGEYTVQLTLTPEDAKLYKAPAGPTPVTLSPGEDRELVIEIPKIVWFKIRLKYKDDEAEKPEAKFALMLAEKSVAADPLTEGLGEVNEMEDGAYAVSFPEIDAAEWDLVVD